MKSTKESNAETPDQSLAAQSQADRAYRGWYALATIAIAGLAYILGAARHVLGHDNGEYLVVGAEGGAPHPPGYPLYVLWLRLASLLPTETPAHASSLGTAAIGIATLAVIYQAARRWYCSRLAAASAMAVYALSPRTWLLVSHAENLALHFLIASLILFLAAPLSPVSNERRAPLIGLVFGLGLANHHSILLLAPLGLWAIVRGGGGPKNMGVRFAKGFAASLLGLVPYLYPIAIASQPKGRWVWGNLQSPEALWAYFRRAEYGSFSLIAQRDGSVTATSEQLANYVSRFAEDLLWVPAIIVLLVLVADLAQLRFDAERRRWHPAALAAAFLLSGPLFASQLSLRPRGIGLYQLARMYALSELVATVILARGLHQIFKQTPKLKRWLGPVPVVVAMIAGLFAAPSVQEHHRPTIEWYLSNTLQSLPKNAVLMGKGDLRLFGTLYLQRIRKQRSDVLFIKPSMLFRDWYRQRIEKKLHQKLDMVSDRGIDMVALAKSLMRGDRPLFIMDTDANHEAILQRFGNYPYGTTIRILPAGEKAPSLEAIEKLNMKLLSAFRLEAEPKLKRGSFRAFAYQDYLRPWHYLEAEYAAAKRGKDAARVERLRCRISKRCP